MLYSSCGHSRLTSFSDLIGQNDHLIGKLLQRIVYLLEGILSLGRVRNIVLWPGAVQHLNIKSTANASCELKSHGELGYMLSVMLIVL